MTHLGPDVLHQLCLGLSHRDWVCLTATNKRLHKFRKLWVLYRKVKVTQVEPDLSPMEPIDDIADTTHLIVRDNLGLKQVFPKVHPKTVAVSVICTTYSVLDSSYHNTIYHRLSAWINNLPSTTRTVELHIRRDRPSEKFEDYAYIEIPHRVTDLIIEAKVHMKSWPTRLKRVWINCELNVPVLCCATELGLGPSVSYIFPSYWTLSDNCRTILYTYSTQLDAIPDKYRERAKAYRAPMAQWMNWDRDLF